MSQSAVMQQKIPEKLHLEKESVPLPSSFPHFLSLTAKGPLASNKSKEIFMTALLLLL